MKDLLTQLLGIQDALATDRQPWESVWKEINELVLPRKSDVGGINSPGVYRERRRFDSTAMNGNERMAASIVGNLTPQTLDWFELSMPSDENGRTPADAEAWAQAVAKKMHEVIQQSNFASELEESFLDMGAPGTGAVFSDRAPRKDGRFGGLAFQSWAIGEYWASEGADGLTNRVHRAAMFTAEQMEAKFGRKNLHEKVRKNLEKGKRLEKCKILQCIWVKAPGESVSKKTDKFPVANVFVDLTNKHLIEVGGFWEFPVAVGRWRKTSGEYWGRGPGMTALPDIQILNEADKLGIQAWGNNILPPLLQLHEGVIGRPDLRSRRINTITEKDALSFLVAPTDVNVELVRRQDKQSSIREIYFMDQIQFLPDRGKTPPTASEVQARLNIMLQILGPTLHRIEWEMLQPIINRVFQILWREGELPAPPQSVIQMAERSGGRLNIKFVGPIARARKQAEIAAIDAFLARAQTIAAVSPEAMDSINLDEVLRYIARSEGVPLSLFRTADELKRLQDQRAKVAQQQQALLNAKMAGDAARSVAQAEQAGAGLAA